MRIIAGKYGGRVIMWPGTARTRPMTDKVREALFNLVGPVEGWRILDAYAGSGAIAFEALSRGATQAVAIESAREPLRSINETKLKLSVGEQLKVLNTTVIKAVPQLENQKFNLICADPPYDSLNERELSHLAAFLSDEGVMVVSHSSRISPPQLESMERIDTRKYGDSSLSFYIASS